ncbi:hypothetical protein CHLRE_09g415900v5 [Chlamydomonas reinhardtii]|uniref:Sugar phosphate transporter domain-containing protein n=1 Tax=Chlamydomonas reinhardtii TaxID=3055 RepID=A0A2K3DG09_CHLRE|nr:uncharacterized protein CHLRE_09g415900v5 [Chlamydomonas reinhardtii]PNW79459.1 hypothetical protein CHLRE_09g415900v5 [Chlamydomonas reinhardtii]
MSQSAYMQHVVTYGYTVLWIFLSAVVILVNKYILDFAGFHFPIALTLSHMAFCSAVATALIKLGFVKAIDMDNTMYFNNVVPIAALFSGTLWLGNAAYLYLSVSFIQMVKAQMPVTVFLTGLLLGTERYSFRYAANLVVVAIGVGTASYGEIQFDLLGFTLQMGSIVTESFRLVLIQLLLQARGIKLNPVTTLYYIAPACFLFLCFPFTFIEAPKLFAATDLQVPYGLISLSCVAALALNMSVFLLIGRSSALTMNIAGVIKDWLLIMLSVLLYGSPVTTLQLFGYGVAFAGVTWYNIQKIQQTSPPPAAVLTQEKSDDLEKQPLVQAGGKN